MAAGLGLNLKLEPPLEQFLFKEGFDVQRHKKQWCLHRQWHFPDFEFQAAGKADDQIVNSGSDDAAYKPGDAVNHWEEYREKDAAECSRSTALAGESEDRHENKEWRDEQAKAAIENSEHDTGAKWRDVS